MKKLKNIKNYLLNILLILLIVIIPFREMLSLNFSNVIKIIPEILILLTFFFEIIFKKLKFKFNISDYFFGAFLITTFISTVLLNHYSIIMFLYEIRVIVCFYLLYYMFINDTKEKINYSLIKKVTNIVFAIVFIFAIIEKIYNKDILFPTMWKYDIVYVDNFARVYSVFNNPNLFGIYCTLIFCLNFMYERKYHLSTSILMYIILFIGLWISGSRSSIIILIIYLLGQLIYLAKNKKIFIKAGLSILLTIPCIYLINIATDNYYYKINPNLTEQAINDREFGKTSNRLNYIFTEDNLNKSSSNGRIYKIKRGIDIWSHNNIILGSGFGSYGDSAYLKYHNSKFITSEEDWYFCTDNELILILVETGILGFITVGLYFLSLLYINIKNYDKIIYIILLGISCLFNNMFEIPIVMFLFYLLLSSKDEYKITQKNNNPKIIERIFNWSEMKKNKILYVFLLLLPIIDLLTSIITRFFPSIFSLGKVVKGLFVIASIIYIVFINSSKYKKISIYTLICFALYIILYFGCKPQLMSPEYFMQEMTYLFKFFYFPIVLLTFINICGEKELSKPFFQKLLLINLFLYDLLIFMPVILNVGLPSYRKLGLGTIGLYYSANEISTIIILLFPSCYILLNNNKKLLFLITSVLSVLIVGIIGTKVSIAGLIIISIIFLLYYLIENKFKLTLKTLLPVIVFIASCLVFTNGYAVKNFKNNLGKKIDIVLNQNTDNYSLNTNTMTQDEKILEENIQQLKENINKLDSKEKENVVIDTIFSSRQLYLKYTNKIFKQNLTLDTILFGLGFSNTSKINDYGITKLIEMDIFDIFFHLGIIGVVIIITPFTILFGLFIKNRKNSFVWLNGLIIGLIFCISSIAGHVLMSPAVSIYLAIYFILFLYDCKIFKKNKINDNKVEFLALHMGYGGVENAIASVSNMLANEYDVVITTLYNKEPIPFKIDKSVKVNYLLNYSSNRAELYQAIKKLKILDIIKELFKAIYIKYCNFYLIRKAILESDAKAIISTRYKFSKLLNKYGKDDAVLIHQEHTYTINNEYINKLNELIYIDYIVPVSKSLYNAYKNKININLKYIPLSLNYYPSDDEITKITKYNLIAVGRLETIKGFDDLIQVMKELVKLNKKYYLNLFGDGSQREKLDNLIKEYNLEKNIKLWGFKPQSFIKKYYANSSLYIMTSHEESFGLSVLEAMSYGIPSIAFDTAKGTLDFINKENGFVIKNRNAKAMAEKIDSFMSMDNFKKNEYKNNARKTSKMYAYKSVKNEWLSFMKENL